jgi:hypothetical protein
MNALPCLPALGQRAAEQWKKQRLEKTGRVSYPIKHRLCVFVSNRQTESSYLREFLKITPSPGKIPVLLPFAGQ